MATILMIFLMRINLSNFVQFKQYCPRSRVWGLKPPENYACVFVALLVTTANPAKQLSREMPFWSLGGGRGQPGRLAYSSSNHTYYTLTPPVERDGSIFAAATMPTYAAFTVQQLVYLFTVFRQ